MQNIISRIESLLTELERDIDIEITEREDLEEENGKLKDEIESLKRTIFDLEYHIRNLEQQ